jgi:hypothetical protein
MRIQEATLSLGASFMLRPLRVRPCRSLPAAASSRAAAALPWGSWTGGPYKRARNLAENRIWLGPLGPGGRWRRGKHGSRRRLWINRRWTRPRSVRDANGRRRTGLDRLTALSRQRSSESTPTGTVGVTRGYVASCHSAKDVRHVPLSIVCAGVRAQALASSCMRCSACGPQCVRSERCLWVTSVQHGVCSG